MINNINIQEKIFSINNQNFEDLVFEIFNIQYNQNPVYKEFVDYLKLIPSKIQNIQSIPFLPIEFFKTHEVKTGNWKPEHIFRSSGTTAQITSQHFIKDLQLYEDSFVNGFEYFFGNTNQYQFVGLLPSYLERNDASLVYMVDGLMKKSGQKAKYFYLYDFENCAATLEWLKENGKTIFLTGVTFALLDFIEKHKIDLKNHIVLETGGMKGKRKEIIRADLHQQLKASFNTNTIHGEYGMTELLSQAYSKGDGIFECPPWMKILIRDPLDPFDVTFDSSKGAINVIDLCNVHSCSFIATQDLGQLYDNGTFEVTGRMDNAALRGCNLMY